VRLRPARGETGERAVRRQMEPALRCTALRGTERGNSGEVAVRVSATKVVGVSAYSTILFDFSI
jgi:hypothetical protein